jgi:hypothetical protein
MISDIRNAIVYKLKELFQSCKRYVDDIPQNFSKPAFVVFEIDQDYSKRHNTKYNGRISFDIAYFSDKPEPEIKSDCFAKQETLLRGFDFITSYVEVVDEKTEEKSLVANQTYKVTNKNARITDNVLHMTFDVRYSELKKTTEVQMSEQTTNTSL